jgi:hypothetical protein
MGRNILTFALAFLGSACSGPGETSFGLSKSSEKLNYIHPIPFNPRTYVCYRAEYPLRIDGKMDENSWTKAPWTEDFVDIEGDLKPQPTYRTRAKMLWDEQYFYFGAQIEEPHLWATLTERDAIMYLDDDFEIFIDPDGNGHYYYEFEMNAHNAIWDLLLLRPYRVDTLPKYLMNWDIKGIKTAVHLNGTLNNPADIDSFWMVEIAIPWSALKEFAPEKRMPYPGEQWRVNFSRVDWPLDIIDGRYLKKEQPQTDEVRDWKVENWVWSPSGRIDMHQPETWGYVQFSNLVAGRATEKFVGKPEEKIKWALWQLYFQQQQHFEKFATYTGRKKLFTIPEVDIPGYSFNPVIHTTQSMFEITAPGVEEGLWHIRSDGRIWKSGR